MKAFVCRPRVPRPEPAPTRAQSCPSQGSQGKLEALIRPLAKHHLHSVVWIQHPGMFVPEEGRFCPHKIFWVCPMFVHRGLGPVSAEDISASVSICLAGCSSDQGKHTLGSIQAAIYICRPY